MPTMNTTSQGLSTIWNSIQHFLFPELAGVLGPLSEKDQEFIRVIQLCELERHIGGFQWVGIGRKPASRLSLAKAFLAMRFYGVNDNKALIERLVSEVKLRRLCGWESMGEVPSESTFSRAFADFAEAGLPQKVHAAMVQQNLGGKLVGHISRDSTAVEVRERPVRKESPQPTAQPIGPQEVSAHARQARRGGRPQGEERRLALQPGRTLEENLADLPTACNVGTKRNSKGHTSSWIGYKLHVDTADCGVPVSAILTSASVHDSQVAIPLAQMTAGRVTNCYDMMDSAYDAKEIHEFSRHLGHVPIIDANRRRSGEKAPFEPATARRYNERTAAERTNSSLKDNYLPKDIRVRGVAKVSALLMFALLPITANALYNMLL